MYHPKKSIGVLIEDKLKSTLPTSETAFEVLAQRVVNFNLSKSDEPVPDKSSEALTSKTTSDDAKIPQLIDLATDDVINFLNSDTGSSDNTRFQLEEDKRELSEFVNFDADYDASGIS
ncbi:MAG: hypothetical protein LBQ84_09240 [Flavobacteriaceae bacterium]|jgi:hypothetical protein|nr:hypothetical protein [Flavobacteriaceae bacterium]